MELTRNGDITSTNHKNGVEAAKEGIFFPLGTGSGNGFSGPASCFGFYGGNSGSLIQSMLKHGETMTYFGFHQANGTDWL